MPVLSGVFILEAVLQIDYCLIIDNISNSVDYFPVRGWF